LFRQGIRETLRNANLVVEIVEGSNESPVNESTPFPKIIAKKGLNGKMPMPDDSDQKRTKPSDKAVEIREDLQTEIVFSEKVPDQKVTATVAERTETFNTPDPKSVMKIRIAHPDFTKMKIIGQLFNTYILLEGIKEIYLIDQHAAHEAFLTRELESIFDHGTFIPSQGLMAPVTLKIRPKDMSRVMNALDTYKKLGYDCDVFGEDSLIIRSVPVFLGEPQSSKLLENLINENIFEIEEDHSDKQWLYSSTIKEKIILMACKAAIKGGQTLNNQEIHQLLEDLMGLDNPFTCPHGRPVITKLKEYELMKLFKRVV